MSLGRPPSVRLSYVDCEYPLDEEATLDENGNYKVGRASSSRFSFSFHLPSLPADYQWKYEFCREIFSHILELTLTAEAPTYQTILELDRKVREKLLPSHLNAFMAPDADNCMPSTFMHGSVLGQFRTVSESAVLCITSDVSDFLLALLYIHRSFFAQAMLDHPINPLRSPYAPSFLAAYRCASGVIKSSLNYHERYPQLCGRFWAVWTHRK